MTPEQLIHTLERIFNQENWPSPFPVISEVGKPHSAVEIADLARSYGLTRKRVTEILGAEDPVVALFGSSTPDERASKRARQILGNLIVGRCAEIEFVDRYRREAATNELNLIDVREGRSDTDYRLLNGRGRPVYRINIKFVGSVFRRAQELVGIEPTDCFALATYKINAALQKQEADRLPFLFIIVSVPGLSADSIGARADDDTLEFLGLLSQAKGIKGKRDIEDRVVANLEAQQNPAFVEILDRIRHGSWHVLSARRADKLLREKLFDRVYALRIRGFAQQFRGAELDMHFSLSNDLTTLEAYLHKLQESGYPMVTTMLERGEF